MQGSLTRVLYLASPATWQFTRHVVGVHALWFNYWQFIPIVSDRNLTVAISILCPFKFCFTLYLSKAMKLTVLEVEACL